MSLKLEVIKKSLVEKGFLTRRNNVMALVTLPQAEYDRVVLHLLASGEKNSVHSGCSWFALRPNRALYPQILDGAISIFNPSDCRDGVVALLQVKSPDQVAADLHAAIDINATDRHNSAIISMYYWLGFLPGQLTRNNAWPGYVVEVYLYNLRNSGLVTPVIATQPLTPSGDMENAKVVSRRIIETMLNLFESNNENDTARGIIGSLAPVEGRYPEDLLPRIRRMYELAKQSNDEYVRHRVSQYSV
ncbi:MAG: hypothetical protein AAF787_14890 [Chloroflexota bacterium]